jgi:hypothetical protein
MRHCASRGSQIKRKYIGKFIHILVAEVVVVSLQLLFTAVTFTKCYHTFTCSHCTEFWRHVLTVTSSSAERTLSRVRIIKNRLSTSIAFGVVEGDAVGWHPPNEQVSRVDAIAVASPNQVSWPPNLQPNEPT